MILEKKIVIKTRPLPHEDASSTINTAPIINHCERLPPTNFCKKENLWCVLAIIKLC